jgi:hypothetical protein
VPPVEVEAAGGVGGVFGAARGCSGRQHAGLVVAVAGSVD